MTREEILSKAKQILFTTDMVRAILDGRKTVIRRPVKPPPSSEMPNKYNICKMPILTNDGIKTLWYMDVVKQYPFKRTRYFEKVAPYEIGDILYVRETWGIYAKSYMDADYVLYRADYSDNAKTYESDEVICDLPKWHPSIHMPKEAARIFLRVTNVSVAKLQDIITGDYKTLININKEGLLKPCQNCTHHNGDCKDFISDNTCRLVDNYIALWNSTVKKSELDKYGWEANLWVWVIEFERVEVEQ